MANKIYLKGKVDTNLAEFVAFEASVSLEDETTAKVVNATYSVETSGDTIPLIGITQYGRITGLAAGDTAFTIKAVPLGDDGTNAVTVDTDVESLLGTEIDDEVAEAE